MCTGKENAESYQVIEVKDPMENDFFCFAMAIHLGRHIKYLKASLKLVDSIGSRAGGSLSPFLTF